MDYSELLARRRSTRRFDTGRDVPDDVLARVLAAPLAMPHAGNTYDWRGVVLRRRDRDPATWPAVYSALLEQSYVEEAAVVVAYAVQPHVHRMRQESEAELNVRIAQRVALVRIGLEQQDRAGNGWQERFRLVAVEHRQRSSVDRGQHVWIELMQAERLVGEIAAVLAHYLTRRAELVPARNGHWHLPECGLDFLYGPATQCLPQQILGAVRRLKRGVVAHRQRRVADDQRPHEGRMLGGEHDSNLAA